MIQVKSLTKLYGTRKAIDSLTFHANRGEIVGFLGPNGAGKTTTMRILTGYMPASEGTATVAGFDVFEESIEVRRRVGYLPETVPLYDDMAVWQFLDFMAELRRVPNRQERVEEVMEMVHMHDRADTLIGNISKGMRQRVGLAQAILHEPEVLILDEPTIGLDPEQVRDVRTLIRDIGKDRTVMLSTHILSEAQAICNRVMIINQGRIVATDTPQKLQERLAAGEQVRVRIGGATDSAARTMAKAEGVLEVREIGEGAYEVDLASEAARAELARAIVQSKLDLLEMRALDMSLEDIYLRLVQEPSAGSN
ncbi:MAG: ABC transporter ATP-binding protein [Anaerolineales bacterium]